MKTLYITGIVGWTTTIEKVNSFLNKAAGEDIIVFIDSPGGYVDDAYRIVNSLNVYKGKKTIVLGALAASAASYIAVAVNSDKIYSHQNTMFMYHNAWGVAIGDYQEMRSFGYFLEKMSDIIADAIAKKTEKDKKKIRKEMDDTTWLFSQEVLDQKFSDSLVDDVITAQIELPEDKASVRLYDFLDSVALDSKKQLVKAELENFQFSGKKKSNFTEIAALLGESVEKKPDVVPVKNISNLEGRKMNFKEFKEQNPSALSEILTSPEIVEHVEKAVNQARENVLQLIDVSGGTLNTEARDAITRGLSPEQYALNVLKREQTIRQQSANNLSGFAGKDSAAFNSPNGEKMEKEGKIKEEQTGVGKAIDKAFELEKKRKDKGVNDDRNN